MIVQEKNLIWELKILFGSKKISSLKKFDRKNWA